MSAHFWQGEWLDDAELRTRVETLEATVQRALERRLPAGVVLAAAARLSTRLRLGMEPGLREALAEAGDEEPVRTLKEIAEFLAPGSLRLKILRELGTSSTPGFPVYGDPGTLTRIDFRTEVFEAWAPLGFLVHLAPTNAAAVGALSLVEGLLAGNLNFVKLGGTDGSFAPFFAEALCREDASGELAARIIVARIPSTEQELLRKILASADGVAAWGGEAGIEGARRLSPSSARFVDWGPKLSFGYIAREKIADDATLTVLAQAVCEVEQQACSSPQCAYLEVESTVELREFGQRLARKLAEVSSARPARAPGPAEQGEITTVTELCREEACLGLSEVIEAPDHSWRILIEFASGLRASPLYRTLWLKPLPATRIAATLRPLRAYLQTVGLAAPAERTAELTRAFFQGGALRVTPLGEMLGSYVGEPHDGVYALARYSRRVSFRAGAELSLPGVASFADLETTPPVAQLAVPVLTKTAFQARTVAPEYSELFFKSGGSSGDPKLSVFTYDDYHRQMNLAAEGLYAAGLDPRTDRSMNLFFGGGLYGGFVSFFSILEVLKIAQFPMAAHADLAWVGQTIVAQGVNVLLGMPSYLIQLFRENDERFRNYRGIRKVYYGGEHFNETQAARLRERYGVEIVRSASYGSVDAGPLAFQCAQSTGSMHHLHTRLHQLEILKSDSDEPVAVGEPGRLIFTSLVRSGQALERYEIGDIGRAVPGPCACGRRSPRFELLGRHGDVFRVGAIFLSYQKISRVLADHFGYADEVQIRIQPPGESGREGLRVEVSDQAGLEPAAARAELLSRYKDLAEAVEHDGVLELGVFSVAPASLVRTAGSGKLRHVLDERGSRA